MLNNLKKELAAKKITTKSFAEFLGICEKSATNKLNGKTEFTHIQNSKKYVIFFFLNIIQITYLLTQKMILLRR